jgi:hypothetical protein
MSASIPRTSPETRIAVQRRRDIKESSKEMLISNSASVFASATQQAGA